MARQQTLWKVLDSSSWWTTIDFLRPNELLAGDILITKNYKMSGSGGISGGAKGTVHGQNIMSWMCKSSGYSTHAMVFTGIHPGDGGLMLAHSSSGSQWQTFDGAATYTKKPNIVFRPNDTDLGLSAARYAIRLCGYNPETGASLKQVINPTEEELAAYERRILGDDDRLHLLAPDQMRVPQIRTEGFIAGGYTAKGRKMSVLRLKRPASKTQQLLQRVRDNDLANLEDGETRTGTDLFCSAFAALVYELDGPILNVDPMAMSVKALESVLNRSRHFQLIGRTWNHDKDDNPLL